MPDISTESVAMIGGTGPLGRGLAARLGGAGLRIYIGSRDAERAAQIARELPQAGADGAGEVIGVSNQDAVTLASLIVITVPYEALADQLSSLRGLDEGKVLVSTAVPMVFNGGLASPFSPAAGSATAEVGQLCPAAPVVGAFHTVSASGLLKLAEGMDEDVLVSGEDPNAKERVNSLIRCIPGLRPVDIGGLQSAGLSETITPLLLRLNRMHRAHTGIRITGL